MILSFVRADFGRAVARGRDAGGPAKRGAEVWAVDDEVGAGLQSAARRRAVAGVGLPVGNPDKRGGVAGAELTAVDEYPRRPHGRAGAAYLATRSGPGEKPRPG